MFLNRPWRHLKDLLEEVGREGLDLFFPKTCLVCKAFSREEVCVLCESLLFKKKNCKIRYGIPFVNEVHSFLPYSGAIQTLLIQSKFKGNLKILHVLRRPLVHWVQDLSFPSIDYVMPIPLHPRRFSKRGFNQVEVLFETSAGLLGSSQPHLLRSRSTKPLFDLDLEARKKELEGAFRLAAGLDLEDKTILLLDDILTTGTTLSEAARVLRESGAKAVYGLTFSCVED